MESKVMQIWLNSLRFLRITAITIKIMMMMMMMKERIIINKKERRFKRTVRLDR